MPGYPGIDLGEGLDATPRSGADVDVQLMLATRLWLHAVLYVCDQLQSQEVLKGRILGLRMSLSSCTSISWRRGASSQDGVEHIRKVSIGRCQRCVDTDRESCEEGSTSLTDEENE